MTNRRSAMPILALPILALLPALAVPPPAPVAAAPPAAASAPLPDTPAGRALGSFLAALGSGDEARLRAFHEAYAGADERGKPVPEQRIARGLRLHADTGGIDVVEVVSSSPYRIEVEARARRDGRPMTVAIEVEPTPPNGVDGIELRPGKPEKPLPEDGRPIRSLADLEAWLAANAEAGRFSGVVRYDRPGREPWVRAWGLADREAKRPVTAATRFHIGSMNKMFTAVAVMQLVEEGKLALDAPVGRYLPDYPERSVRETVTVRHLLTHTSGLGAYWNERFRERKGSIRTVSDYLALFSDEPPSFPPGERFRYSNSGYVVLGAILEKVTGESYYDLVKRRVFDRAGMADSGYPEVTARDERVATGYTSEGGPSRPNLDTLPNRGGPAGGGVSTAEDLARFAEALRAGRLVSPATLAQMTTPATRQGPDFGYGFGFGVEEREGRRSFGHNGGAPGMAAEMKTFPETGETLVVLANRDPGVLGGVVRRLEAATGAGKAAPAEAKPAAR